MLMYMVTQSSLEFFLPVSQKEQEMSNQIAWKKAFFGCTSNALFDVVIRQSLLGGREY